MSVVSEAKKVVIDCSVFTDANQAGFAESKEIDLAGDINCEAVIV